MKASKHTGVEIGREDDYQKKKKARTKKKDHLD